MALTTAGDICTFASKAGGILGVGQTPLAQDTTDTFDALNGMIGQWARRRWLVWCLIDKYAVSTGAQSYTIGPGEDFDTPRPDRLESAFVRQIVSAGNNIDYPLQILESREDYNRIALKTLASWPSYIFYDSAFPVGSIYLWPIPQAGIFEIHVSLKQPLTQFTDVTTQIDMPPEYIEALWSNLALRLAAFYPGAVITEFTVGIAKAALQTIRGANLQVPTLVMPTGMVRPPLYNIYSGRTY
jgi:hypothetical protein